MLLLRKDIWLISLMLIVHLEGAQLRGNDDDAVQQTRKWHQTRTVRSSRPFNHCGDSADPNSLPFSNMAAALNGYDLPKGDPFSSTLVDPGWRHQIFVPTRRDDRGCTVPESGITSSDLNSCTGKFSSEVITSYRGYRDRKLKSFTSGYDLNAGLNIDVGVEKSGVSASTTLPPMVTRSSTEQESEAKISSFFSQEKGVMVFREALCLTHRLFIDDYDIPPFTRGFNLSIRALYNAPESSRVAEFKRFIRKYGTHYSSETQMGAKFSHFHRYSSVDRKTQDSNTFKKCSELTGMKIIWLKVEKDNAECQQFYQKNRNFHSQHVEKSHWVTYGSRPAETNIEWAQQTLDNPIPIRMKFQPIPNLFTDNLMTRFGPGIDASTLKAWFLPLYLDYCNLFNLDCAPRLGCGLSYDCRWGDTCVPDPSSLDGHRCTSYILGEVNENCNQACNRKLGKACSVATIDSLTLNEKIDIFKSFNYTYAINGFPGDNFSPANCNLIKSEVPGYDATDIPQHILQICECDQDSCANHRCMNGGKCFTVNGHHTCRCRRGFFGSECQQKLSVS